MWEGDIHMISRDGDPSEGWNLSKNSSDLVEWPVPKKSFRKKHFSNLFGFHVRLRGGGPTPNGKSPENFPYFFGTTFLCSNLFNFHPTTEHLRAYSLGVEGNFVLWRNKYAYVLQLSSVFIFEVDSDPAIQKLANKIGLLPMIRL